MGFQDGGARCIFAFVAKIIGDFDHLKALPLYSGHIDCLDSGSGYK